MSLQTHVLNQLSEIVARLGFARRHAPLTGRIAFRITPEERDAIFLNAPREGVVEYQIFGVPVIVTKNVPDELTGLPPECALCDRLDGTG